MAAPIPKKDKEAILKNARTLRESLKREANKYKQAAAKQPKSSRTRDYYQKAAEVVSEKMSNYTQKKINADIKEGRNEFEELRFETDLQKTFNRFSKENVARRILTTSGNADEAVTQAGARFYGGLSALWRGKTSYEDRNAAIKDFFGMDNLLDIMQHIEEKTGLDLIKMLSDREQYDEAVGIIQSFVSTMYDEEEL